MYKWFIRIYIYTFHVSSCYIFAILQIRLPRTRMELNIINEKYHTKKKEKKEAPQDITSSQLRTINK